MEEELYISKSDGHTSRRAKNKQRNNERGDGFPSPQKPKKSKRDLLRQAKKKARREAKRTANKQEKTGAATIVAQPSGTVVTIEIAITNE